MKVRNKEEAERLKGLEETYGLMVMPQMSFTEDNFEELFPLLDDMGEYAKKIVFLLTLICSATICGSLGRLKRSRVALFVR
jgi:hypothetical protein